MRLSAKMAGLVGAALLVVAPAHATAFTQAQLTAAQNGLQAMRELNVITFGNLTSSSEVEGKAFVGGNLSGGNYGIGNSNSAETASSRAVLTVGGNLSGNVNVNNGNNGSGGAKVVGSAAENVVKVGGNSTGTLNMNSASSNLAGQVKVGGSFNNQNFNPNSTKTATYGTSASNVQAQDTAYVTKDATLASGGSNSMATSIMNEATTLKSNLQQLSDVLSTLSTNATLNLSDRNNIVINYTSAASSADYVVINVNASDLFNGGGTLNLSLLSSATTGTGYKTTVINVLGSGSFTYSLNNNDNQNSNDQNIIWNFDQSASSNTSLALSSAFHGSVLAPNLTLSNSNVIEGSVVASVFNQSGEVHLGTYNGTSSIVTQAASQTAVPEPGTWVMMMIGFGLIGGLVRQQKQLGVLIRI